VSPRGRCLLPPPGGGRIEVLAFQVGRRQARKGMAAVRAAGYTQPVASASACRARPRRPGRGQPPRRHPGALMTRLTLSAVALLTVAACCRADGSNLVANGSFERSTIRPGVPDDWSAAGNAAVRQELGLDTGRDGGCCARLRCTAFGGDGPDAHAMLCQVGKVGVTRGRWYRLSFWARAEGSRPARSRSPWSAHAGGYDFSAADGPGGSGPVIEGGPAVRRCRGSPLTMARLSDAAGIPDGLCRLPRDIRFRALGSNPSPGFHKASRLLPVRTCRTGAGRVPVGHLEANCGVEWAGSQDRPTPTPDPSRRDHRGIPGRGANPRPANE
jgi:hypothetical protein